MRFFRKKNKKETEKARQSLEIEFAILEIVMECGMKGISFNELREVLRTNPKMLKKYLSNLSFALEERHGSFPSWRGRPANIKIFPIPSKTKEVYDCYKMFFDERAKMLDTRPSA
jgi:hypothetical protein